MTGNRLAGDDPHDGDPDMRDNRGGPADRRLAQRSYYRHDDRRDRSVPTMGRRSTDTQKHR